MNNWDCMDCYDEGVVFFGDAYNFDSEFCGCTKGLELENEYCEWYATNELNEYTREMENA